MANCLGCQRLEDETVKLVELSTGHKVCTYCPEWMLETEAMELLAKPLADRKRQLLGIEAKRGTPATEMLKQRMTLIHGQRKKAATKNR